jgi:capsule polysaccharide export protein KpsE/RkpR
MARSQATYKGVKAENLMDVVEPENFIVCVLHNQMGLVNKSLEHLLLLAEKDIEKLPKGHAETRKNLLETEKAFQNMKDEMESFVNTGQLRLNASKNQAKASLTNEEREEIDGLKAESERLDKQVEKAKSQLKKCKGNDATLANSTQSSQKSF